MEKPKKRYIIRTYTQGSSPAVQEIGGNVPTITGNDLRETVFRNQRQFLYFVGEDLRTVILRKFTAYMRPVPIVPHFTRIFIYGSWRRLFQRIQRFQRVERIERIRANAKTQLLGENATFGRKYNLLRKTADLQH